MNYVRAAIDWIKSNPITVVCIVVALASLVSFIYPTYSMASAFRAEIAGRDADIKKIDGLMSSSIQVPPETLEAEAPPLSGVITAADVKELDRIYGSIGGQYDKVLAFLVGFNKGYHDPMADGLFPAPRLPQNRFTAKTTYASTIVRLYEALDAAEPRTDEWRQDKIKREEERFMRSVTPALTTLDGENRAKANERIALVLQNEYKRHAREHHIYTPKVVLEISGQNPKWEAGAFHVDGFAKIGGEPTMSDLWEGQMQIWIQQDLVGALRMVNRIAPPDNPQVFNDKTSIADQPVKSLEQIVIEEVYVGIGGAGGRGGPGMGAPGAAEAEAPTGVQTAEDYEKALKEGIAADFVTSNSVTGRRSNPLYDVRHVKMTVVVDYNRIPELFDALRQVNFMTVLDLRMTDVDEYEDFRNGYYYGEGVDAVRLEMTIETIWMREWTAGTPLTREEWDAKYKDDPKMARAFDDYAGLMPDVIRHKLNLPVRDPRSVATLQQEQQRNSGQAGGGAGGFGQPRGRQRSFGGANPPGF